MRSTDLKKLYETMLVWSLFVLVLTLVFVGEGALADRKIASIRGAVRPASANGAKLKSSLVRPTEEQMNQALRGASLDAIGRIFVQFNTPTKLREALLEVIPPKDREEVAVFLQKGDGKFEVQRVADSLVIGYGADKITLRWPKFPANTINVEGVDWTLSSHQSLKFNIELFYKRYESAHRKSAKLSLLMPEAVAGPEVVVEMAASAAIKKGVLTRLWQFSEQHPIISGALVTTATTLFAIPIRDGSYRFLCWLGKDANDWTLASCKSYLQDEIDVRELRAKLKTLDTQVPMKIKKVDSTGVDKGRWFSGNVAVCPVDKDKSYIADMIHVKVLDGERKSTTPWYAVRIDVEPETGKITSGWVAPAGTDMKSPEREEKAHVIFGLNSSGILEMNVRNQSKTNSSSVMVPIKSDVDEAKLEPWLLAEKNNWTEFIDQVRYRIEECIVSDDERKFQKEEARKKAMGQPSSIPVETPASSTGTGKTAK